MTEKFINQIPDNNPFDRINNKNFVKSDTQPEQDGEIPRLRSIKGDSPTSVDDDKDPEPPSAA